MGCRNEIGLRWTEEKAIEFVQTEDVVGQHWCWWGHEEVF